MTRDSAEKVLLSDIERLKSPQGYLYAGLPHFPGLYARDGLISGWQMLKRDPSIARATLRLLARTQGKQTRSRTEEEPGKIIHVNDFKAWSLTQRAAKLLGRILRGFPYYGSVDSTPLFVIAAREYARATGDNALITELWPHIESCVNWLGQYADLDGDGLVKYRPRNPFGLQNQGWKDGIGFTRLRPPVALVEVQGYGYAAYQAAITLARAAGKETHDWDKQAAALKRRFNEQLWMEEAGFFALALDGRKRQVGEITSNPGHLLFTGILDKDRQERVVARLFEKDMMTDYGLRTHSSLSRYFRKSHLSGAIWPSDNWMVWIGLARCGYKQEAQRIKSGLLRAFEELGRIPEFYDVVNGKVVNSPRLWHGIPVGKPCYPQAWACGALLSMLDEG